MKILTQLEPIKVFDFFEKICNIPHGSGNIEHISEYLVTFAKARNLFYIQDELKNVILVKEATKGYEGEEPIIIQGHMDMVAVKEKESVIDLEKEGLQLFVEGDFIAAKGTSLGGDDGIAIAYALAILDAVDIEHPRLEVVITVDEEVGMDGAIGVDLSMLKGKRMINIDSEEEGILLASCAGGGGVQATLPVIREQKEGLLYEVVLSGLLGGHSGIEIHKERGNANVLMARILFQISKEISVRLRAFSGGTRDNVIPSRAEATIMIEASEEKKLEDLLNKYEDILKKELITKDPDIAFGIKKEGVGILEVLTKECTKKVFAFVLNQPSGVQAMSSEIVGLVETSLNLGVLKLEQERISLRFSVRSSVESAKEFLIDRLCLYIEIVGGKYKLLGDYPGWEYRHNSPFREKMMTVYQNMYEREVQVQAVHAGLECGIIASKIENLDAVSLGPNMFGIHTTKEKISISSTKRVWEYLLEVLKAR